MPLATAARQPDSAQTEAQPSTLLLTSLIDCAGVTRGKTVPMARAASVARSGVGASPSWALFCVDNAIAWIPSITAVGDHRLRPDLSAAVRLDETITWAPAEVYTQEGETAFWCSRQMLRRQCECLAARGIAVKSAGEIEFFLLPADEAEAERPWHAYGISTLMEREGFVAEVTETFTRLGLGLEQFHGEYGGQQYELSLSPAEPVAAMDKIALARILLGRIARRHGGRISLSPQPFAGGVGNGAHTHFSFTQGGRALLAGGAGPHGITAEGGAIIAGLQRHLPEMVGILAPSILSTARLQPGHWSGAFACWGKENREAAIRYCAATPGNPQGAHLEVKCIDPSANPYAAAAAVLAMAEAGLAAALPLPAEMTEDPGALSDDTRAARGIAPLGGDHASILDRLEASPIAAGFPPEMLAALLAVRRHETRAFGHLPLDGIAEALRYAWSV